MYGTLDNVEALIVFKDKRKLSDRQRAFYRALLNNIFKWCGEGTDELHEFFKEEYFLETGERISTKDNSENSKSDMNKLLEIVIDFMFEFDVPFAKGYELLPKEESWYLYQCCKHRKCAVCGKHSEIHHIDTVGAGNNRNKVDHTKKLVISACRQHHSEAHNLGNDQFLRKYKLAGIYLSYQDFNDLGMMSQKLIDELENKK
nr:putative HNHc nuclease [Vagococcus fluvialis]